MQGQTACAGLRRETMMHPRPTGRTACLGAAAGQEALHRTRDAKAGCMHAGKHASRLLFYHGGINSKKEFEL